MDVATIVSPGVSVAPPVAVALTDAVDFGCVVSTLADLSSTGGLRGVEAASLSVTPLQRPVDAPVGAALRDLDADGSTLASAILLPGRGGAVLLSVHVDIEVAGSSAPVLNLPGPTSRIGIPGVEIAASDRLPTSAWSGGQNAPKSRAEVPPTRPSVSASSVPVELSGSVSNSRSEPTAAVLGAARPAPGGPEASADRTAGVAVATVNTPLLAVAGGREDVAPERSGDTPADRPIALRHKGNALRGAPAKISSQASGEVFAPAVPCMASLPLAISSLTSDAPAVASADAPQRTDGSVLIPGGLVPPLETSTFVAIDAVSAGPSPTNAEVTEFGSLPLATRTPAGVPASPLDATAFAPASQTAAMPQAPIDSPATPGVSRATPSVQASRRPAAMLAARGGQPSSAIAAAASQPQQAARYALPLLHRQGDPPAAVSVATGPESAAPDRAAHAAPIELPPAAPSSAFATLVGEVGLDAPPAAPGLPMPYRAPQAANDIGIVIAQRLANGAREVTIRLNPADFGRIDVRMSFDDSGKLRATVGADNPAVLDLLRRDVGQLVGAMSDAGISSDQRSFRFESQADTGQGQRPAGDGGNQPREQRQSPDRSPFARYAAEDRESATAQPLRWTGQIDVKA